MNMTSLRSLALAVSICILIAAGPFAYDAIAAEVVVSWTEVQEQVRPKQFTGRVAKTVRLSLRGGNVIGENSVSVVGRGKGKSKDIDGRFGNSISSGKSRVSWSVQDSKSLVRTQDSPQQTQVIRITTQSDTACVATVSFRLKPGFREYRLRRSDGELMYFRSLSAENVSCRVNP
jgi:hypothetical protein